MKWRKILVFSMVMILMMPMLAQITGAEGKYPLPENFKNLIVIEKGDLAFGLNAKTGLGTMFNKKTGETWNQWYATPAVGVAASPIAFSDTSYWTIKGAAKIDDEAVLFDLNALGMSDSDGAGSISQHYPGIKITRGNYKVRLTYTAENAIGFGNSISVAFFRNKLNTANNGDNWLNTVRGPSDYVSKVQNGRYTVEFDLKAEDFMDHTGTASLEYKLSVAEGAKGKITIEKLEYIGVDNTPAATVVSDAKKSGNSITLKVNSLTRKQSGKTAADCVISFDDKGALNYTLSIENKSEKFTENIQYPPTFYNNSDDLKWLVAKDSGLLLGATDLDSELNKRLTTSDLYCAGGLNMAFFAGVDETSNSGLMTVIDTPINAKILYLQSQLGDKPGYMPVISFVGDKDLWQEDRQVRFFFLNSGSYVDAAKSYRQIAKEKGYVVTYKEKSKTNKWVERTAVSHRVDFAADRRSLITYFDKLAEAGISNVFTKTSATRDSLAGGAYVSADVLIEEGIYAEIMAKYPDALLYEYENTRDIYVTEGEFKVDADFVAFAQDYRIKGSTGNYYTGWTDITGLAAHIMCQSIAIPYFGYWLQRRPLDKYPTPIKMYDILATCSVAEGQCYHPDHPFNRTDTYNTKIALMKHVVDKGMDAHTEGTAEYLVPYSTSFEGSLGFMGITGIGSIGEQDALANEAERIPLWQLVFHDCAGTYWHWEAGDISRSEENAYCDLFSLLYAERGMFGTYYKKTHVGSSYFQTMLERIKKLNTVLLEVGTEEMVNHEFLSEDGMVQRTTFASGMAVTVNFATEKSYTIDGETLEPRSYTFVENKELVGGNNNNNNDNDNDSDSQTPGGSNNSNTGSSDNNGKHMGMPLWLYIVIGSGIGIIAAVVIIFLLHRKKTA